MAEYPDLVASTDAVAGSHDGIFLARYRLSLDRAVPSLLTGLWSCRTYLAMKRFIPPATLGRDAR
jgi:hypothetical protein